MENTNPSTKLFVSKTAQFKSYLESLRTLTSISQGEEYLDGPLENTILVLSNHLKKPKLFFQDVCRHCTVDYKLLLKSENCLQESWVH